MREKLSVQADDRIRPGARGRAMQDMKFVFAIDFGVRFVKGDNVSERVGGIDGIAAFIFDSNIE